MKSYRDLVVWQKSMDLAVEICRMTDSFPGSELYGLTGQMRRAAASIPSNIAEGHASGQTGIFHRHLRIAAGSLAELETQIELAERVGYLTERSVGLTEHMDHIGRMIRRLRQRLPSREHKTPSPEPRTPSP